MRKTLLVITVLLVATQAYAVNVTMSVVDEGAGVVAIRYSATDGNNVSGFALKVTADSGAIFTAINDFNVGECTASQKGYGIFPGTIDVNELTGLVDNNGTPVAPSWDPCDHAGPTGLATNTLILEMGALYVDGNEPALTGTLILVTVDSDCNVCVDTESIRGNVVLTDANEATTNLPVCTSVGAGGALCPGDVTGTALGFHPQTPFDPAYFDANDWTGPDGDTDFDDLQALIYLVLWDGVGQIVTPVPAYAAAGDVTGTALGFHPQTPFDPAYFDANDWTGPDGDIDFDDLQALIYLVLWDGVGQVYTCP